MLRETVVPVAQIRKVCIYILTNRPMTAPISDGSILPRKSLCSDQYLTRSGVEMGAKATVYNMKIALLAKPAAR